MHAPFCCGSMLCEFEKNGRMFGFVVSNALLKSAIKPRDSKTEQIPCFHTHEAWVFTPVNTPHSIIAQYVLVVVYYITHIPRQHSFCVVLLYHCMLLPLNGPCQQQNTSHLGDNKNHNRIHPHFLSVNSNPSCKLRNKL